MNNLAFEIGFDHYRFDLPLDLSRFEDEHRQQVQLDLRRVRFKMSLNSTLISLRKKY